MTPEELAYLKDQIKKMKARIRSEENWDSADKKMILAIFETGIAAERMLQEHEDYKYFTKKVDTIMGIFQPLADIAEEDSPVKKVIPKLEKMNPARKALTNNVSVKDLTSRSPKVGKK